MQDKNIKTLTAVVVGKSGNKSIKVGIDYKVKHPKYEKYIRRKTELAVHDDKNQSSVGDIVEIAESRPHSKTKRWSLLRIIEKAGSDN